MERPNLMQEVVPCSGFYSFKKDLRLNTWLLVAMVVYLTGSFLLKHHEEWSALVRGTVAVLPVVPGLLYGRSVVRFIRGLDELQRRVQTDACLFAAFGALFVTTVVNTLNAQAVPLGQLSQGLGFGGTFMVTLMLWTVGTGIANCRYK